MCQRENDRNSGSRSFYGEHSLGACRYDDVDLAPNQFDCDLGGPLVASVRVPIIDRDGAAFDPTKFSQPPYKTGNKITHGGRRGRTQESDGGDFHRLLLRPRLARPDDRGPTEQRDEVPPPHVEPPLPGIGPPHVQLTTGWPESLTSGPDLISLDGLSPTHPIPQMGVPARYTHFGG